MFKKNGEKHVDTPAQDAYRKLEPYMAASSTLVGSVAGFTALGYWLDRKMGHSVQWLLLVGAVVGMVSLQPTLLRVLERNVHAHEPRQVSIGRAAG